MMPEWGYLAIQFLVAAGAGVGAYVAIRADLARLHERATQAKERADAAHNRIDEIFNRRSNT